MASSGGRVGGSWRRQARSGLLTAAVAAVALVAGMLAATPANATTPVEQKSARVKSHPARPASPEPDPLVTSGRPRTVSPVGRRATVTGRLLGQPDSPSITPESVADLSAPSLADAKALADSSGQRVRIDDQRTETTTVYANPDGTSSALIHAGPIRFRTSGGWMTANTTLLPQDGRLAVAANATRSTVSAGGADRLLVDSTVTPSGDHVGLNWPTDLPTAIRLGSTTRYPLTAGAVDLVVQALATGVDVRIELQQRPARPVAYTVPLSLPQGWSAIQTSEGAVEIADSDGAVRTRVAPTHASGAADPLTGAPGAGSDSPTQLVSGADGYSLVFAPDPAFLADPRTIYPVVIDPKDSLNDTYDTYVDSHFATSTYYAATSLHVGYYNAGSYTGVDRGYVNFDTSAILNKFVTAGTLSIPVQHAVVCTPNTTEVWGSSGTVSSTTTWTSRPPLPTHYANFTIQNRGDTCGFRGYPVYTDVTNLVGVWSNSGQIRNALGLKAPNEADTNQYVEFESIDNSDGGPSLEVTYYDVPTPPVPASVTAGSTTGSCVVSFTPVTEDPYSQPIDGYRVDELLNGSVVDSRSVTASPVMFSGLNPANTYSYLAYAHNASGYSSAANAGSCLPNGDAPHTFTVSASAGDQTAAVTWTAPDNDGTNGGAPITSYSVTARASDDNSVLGSASLGPASRTWSLGGLTNGRQLYFQVTATSRSGSTTVQSNPVTPSGVPAAPTILDATEGAGPHPGTTDVLVTFRLNGNGGLAVDSCRADAVDPNNSSNILASASATGPDCGANGGSTSVIDISGLTYGQTYNFRVSAHNPSTSNSAGNGAGRSGYSASLQRTMGQDGGIAKAVFSDPSRPASAGPFDIGENLRYALTIAAPSNNDLTVSAVTDTLPAGMQPASVPGVLYGNGAPDGAGNLSTTATCAQAVTFSCNLTNQQVSGVIRALVTISGTITVAKGQQMTFLFPVTVTADNGPQVGVQGRVCQALSNSALLFDNYHGSSPATGPTSSATVASTGCGAGLGTEPWWSYVHTHVGVQADAAVNVANGNLVVTATDSTPIQAHGHLAHVLRRVYNSQDTTIETLPGSLGKGWQLNLGMTDGLADGGVTGQGLRVPTVTDVTTMVTNPLGVTLIDRDGTRHSFTPRALSAPLALTSGAANLAAALPQVLAAPAGRTGCLDVAYDPPAGVHLALWRYLSVASSNNSCDRSTWTMSGAAVPVVLGYAAIRPDRVRTEYDATGQLLALTDPAGASLRYTWNKLHQLASVSENCPSNCRTTTFTYTTGSSTFSTTADMQPIESALGRALTLNDISSLTVQDPARRSTTFTFTTSTLGGTYPAGVRLLTTVVNPDDGVGSVRDRVDYHYQGDAVGTTCGANPGQLCTVTDERGNTSTFGYDAGSNGPLVGPARVTSIQDRRRDSHTGSGYATLLSYSDTSSSPGSSTTVTWQASGNGATAANTDRQALYSGIDSTGRVGSLLEGPSPIGTSTALHNTTFTWDTPSVPCGGLSRQDNDLCSMLRAGSSAPAGSDGSATPNEQTTYRYDDAGMLLQSARALTGTVSLVTTHGYARQWTSSDGTTSTGTEADTPGSSTAVAGNSALVLYSLADLTSTVTPRGNAIGGTPASYRTTFVVDDLASAAPATVQSAGSCTGSGSSTGTATGNTGLVCAVATPYAGGTATTVSTYDSYGALLTRTDPNRHVTQYGYYPDSGTDLSGTTSAGGWLKTITDPTGAFVAFGYDAAGNVIRSWDRTATSDAGLSTSSYPGTASTPPSTSSGAVPHADTSYGPGSFANAAAHPWRWTLASSDNLGNTSTVTRDAAGNLTSSTTARGNTTVMSYDEDNALLSVLTPTNAALTPLAYQLFSYDAFGSQVSSTDPAFAQAYSATPSEAGRTSNVSSRSYYDAVGRRTDTYTVRQTGTSSSGPVPCVNTNSLGDPLLPASAVVCVTSGRYDSVDNTVWTRDASGQATSRSYDAAHRLVQVISPAVNSSIVAGANTSRPQTGYVYDADSNPTTVCRPRQYSEYGGACSDTATGDVAHTSYDARNMATSTSSYRAVGAAALTTSVGYDPAGNVLSSTDRNGHVTSYSYDVLNRRITATVPRTASSSTTTDWIYDPSGAVLAVAEPGPAGSTPGSNIDDRRLTASTLDADHRVVDTVHALQTSLPDGPSSSSSANRAQLRAAMSTALATGTSNTRSRQVYDADGNIVASYTARAFTSSVASATDRSDTTNNSHAPGGFSSGFMTRTDLDADNRPVAVYQARSDSTSTDPLAASLTGNEAAQCTGNGPTTAGLPRYPTGSRVCVATTSYDPDSRPVTVTLPTATASRNGRQITDTYSVDGLLLTSTAPAPSDTTTSGSTPSATATTSSSYDGAGRAITSVDALGLVTATSYSPAGSVVRVDPPTGPNGLNHWTAYSYTLDGQQVWTVTPRSTSGHPTGTPDEIDTEVRGYTADGLLKDLSQPGTTTSDTRHTSYSYDNNGNTTAVKSPSAAALDANNTVGAATTMTYTRDNLLLAVTTPVNPDGSKSRTVSHGYDPAGRETSTTTSVTTTGTTGSTTTGTVSASGYATNDRLLIEHVAAADSHSADSRAYSYDADGNPTCAISNTGSTTAGAAAPGTGTCSSPAATASAVTSTFYLDGLTRTVNERHPSGAQRSTSYSYDGNGAPIAWRQDSASGPATSTVTQNDAGYPISQTGTLLGGTPTSWTYNSNGQPLRQANSNGTLQQWAYNSSDDTLLATGLSGPGRTDSNLAHYQYTYDEQGRILTAEHNGTNPDGSTILPVSYGYAYDAAGRATYFNNAGVVTNSSYDHDSNRLTNGTTTYTYNADDSIATIKTTKATDTGKTQVYDVEGNLTDDGCTTTAFTGFDQTRTVTPKSGASTLDASCGTSTLNYGYDPLGRQINRATSAAGAAIGETDTTATDVYYTGMSTHVLGETTSSDTTVTLPGQTATHSSSTIDYTGSASGTDLAVTSTGSDNTTQYLFDDGTGSIGAVSTSSGGTACVLHYTPAGEAVDDYATTPHQPSANPCSAGSTHDDKQYRGERRDNTSGTYQLGDRTYRPGRAGFTTADTRAPSSPTGSATPVTDPLTANTYAYVNGDPVNLYDPNGHRACSQGDVNEGCLESTQTSKADIKAAKTREARQARSQVINGLAHFYQAAIKKNDELSQCQNLNPTAFATCAAAGDKFDHNRTCDSLAANAWSAYGAGKTDAVRQDVEGANLHGCGTWLPSVPQGKVPLAVKIVVGGVLLLAGGAGLVADLAEVAGLGATEELGSGAALTAAEDGGAVGRVAATCGLSFSPDTPVLLANGETKPISKLSPGDNVVTNDTKTGRNRVQTVEAVLINRDTDLLDLAVADRAGHGSVVHTTAKHPIWDATAHAWVRAIDLPRGHLLRTADGQSVRVRALVKPKITVGAMWDLTVANDHDFYVRAGNADVLVHNCGGLDALSNSGSELDPADVGGSLTRAGRAFAKAGEVFGSTSGGPAAINGAGQAALDEILTNPGTTINVLTKGNFAGGFRFVSPNGVGAVFGPDGTFQYFGWMAP